MRKEKQDTNDTIADKKYRIERHGGRSNNAWRVVYRSDSPIKAKDKYNALWLKVRQGGIRLISSEDEKVLVEYSAPLLRRAW